MNNLRKAAEEYAKTIWSSRATEEEVEQTCEDFIAGYAHAIEVLRGEDSIPKMEGFALQVIRDQMVTAHKRAADFLSQHASSASEVKDE
jgi:hypothetical protein